MRPSFQLPEVLGAESKLGAQLAVGAGATQRAEPRTKQKKAQLV